MLRTDYILRMVEQFGRAMAAIARARQTGDHLAAERLLDQASSDQLGLPLSVVTGQSAAQLMALFSSEGELDPGRCVVAGELLAASADLREAMAPGTHVQDLRRQGFELLLAGYGVLPARERTLYAHKILQLLTLLPDHALGTPEQLRLVRVYEAAGRYDRAEDLLFPLVQDGVEGALALGLALYSELLRRKDPDLEQGGLPRDEVLQGLAELEHMRDAAAP